MKALEIMTITVMIMIVVIMHEIIVSQIDLDAFNFFFNI